MKFKHSALCLIAAASLLPAFASAADIYVRQGAAGANNGSDWANAYTALPSTLVRGNTYYIAAGSYAGRTFNTAASGSTPIVIKKATAASHGTSSGWSDAYGTGQAVFTSGLSFASPYWILDGQTGGGQENGWKNGFGFKIIEKRDAVALIKIGKDAPASNITVRHVAMEGKGSVSSDGGSTSNDGVVVWGAPNVTISHYHMKGIGRGPFFVGANNLVVEHGWVESYFGSSAVHSEIASIWAINGPVGNTTFRYNLFTDIKSTGGIMWDNSSNTSAKLMVYGNVFYKPAGAQWDVANGLIGGWTGGNGEQFHNAKVYNNTFINVDQASLSTLPRIASGNEAYNNIFYNSRSPDFAKFSSHNYNHFINSGGTQGESAGTTSTTDPFVNYIGLDFRLKSGTGAGMNLAAPYNEDAAGNNRGADGTFDRGAYEFVTGAVTVAAPTNLRAQ